VSAKARKRAGPAAAVRQPQGPRPRQQSGSSRQLLRPPPCSRPSSRQRRPGSLLLLLLLLRRLTCVYEVHHAAADDGAKAGRDEVAPGGGPQALLLQVAGRGRGEGCVCVCARGPGHAAVAPAWRELRRGRRLLGRAADKPQQHPLCCGPAARRSRTPGAAAAGEEGAGAAAAPGALCRRQACWRPGCRAAGGVGGLRRAARCSSRQGPRRSTARGRSARAQAASGCCGCCIPAAPTHLVVARLRGSGFRAMPAIWWAPAAVLSDRPAALQGLERAAFMAPHASDRGSRYRQRSGYCHAATWPVRWRASTAVASQAKRPQMPAAAERGSGCRWRAARAL
jgi:hypothetical protein